MSYSVSVVGGGVIGMSVAWELAKRGHFVTVIDAQSPTASTSWTAAGIFPPANFELATDPIDRLRGYSHRVWPEWSDELKRRTGIDVGLIRCGGYYLAETNGEAAAMVGMTAYWAELGIACQPISKRSLVERQPRLQHWIDENVWINKNPDRAAWWVEDEYQIRPPRILKALRAVCSLAGVRFLDSSRVIDIDCGDNESQIFYRVVTDDQASGDVKFLSSERVVMCGGAATGFIATAARLQNALIPVRGQIVLLRTNDWTDPCILNVGNRYLVSRGDGYVLAGSCEEEVGFEKQTTTAMINEIHRFASQVCRSFATAEIAQSWAGLRPMTFDGFPMIGRLPDRPSVYVAAGHYRSGIHLAPATAIVIADLMEQKETFMDLSAFAVGKQQSHTNVVAQRNA